MTSEESILEFVASSFRSVWALEILLALKRGRDRAWPPPDIIRELRSSRLVVAEALGGLIAAGLVTEEDGGTFRYAAAGGIDDLVTELEKLYAVKPAAVVHKIVTSPNLKLQILSDAFRIKE